jgi:Type II secretion system (T2SS), protein E, N-terminal domain
MPLLSRRVNAASLSDSKYLDAGHLADRPEDTPLHRRGVGAYPGLLVECANQACTSGWLHLWRSRTTPIFENGWTCSPECTAARVRAAVMRELGGLEGPRTEHRHRIPLGLLMLEQGWITQAQLRRALDAQKKAGTGRLGHWLVRQGAANESLIARALALQWSCPVLTLEGHDPAEVSAVIPRLFLDAFGALPLRVTAGKVLYLGFEESLDPALALAIERMTGLRVESGIVQESSFRPAHARMLKAKFPSIELVESVSETAAAFALARSIERARPIAARLVRVHECLWLRMWQRPSRGLPGENASVRDVVCSIGAF